MTYGLCFDCQAGEGLEETRLVEIEDVDAFFDEHIFCPRSIIVEEDEAHELLALLQKELARRQGETV